MIPGASLPVLIPALHRLLLPMLIPGKLTFCLKLADFICRIDRKKDKIERKILDSQERAFWDVHRPVVSLCLCTWDCSCLPHTHSWLCSLLQLLSYIKENIEERSIWFPVGFSVSAFQPGCVNTTEMDIRKCRRMKNPHRVKKVKWLNVGGGEKQSSPTLKIIPWLKWLIKLKSDQNDRVPYSVLCQ